MSLSVVWYLKEFFRGEWLHNFLFAKTAPLETPPHFRDFPKLTGKECTGCLECVMICPTPGAIEIIKTEDVPEPQITPGHCIRCGLCVEACPEGVLLSGRVLDSNFYDNTAYVTTNHLTVDHSLCMRCGNCSVACPINKEIDPILAANGTVSSDEVIMCIQKGELTIMHPEKCTGCKTCENTCSNGAIRVARVVEAVHDREGIGL